MTDCIYEDDWLVAVRSCAGTQRVIRLMVGRGLHSINEAELKFIERWPKIGRGDWKIESTEIGLGSTHSLFWDRSCLRYEGAAVGGPGDFSAESSQR